MDLANVRELDAAWPDEAVVDRDDRLGHDRERRLVEQIVGLGDRADERALDGENAVGDPAGGDGVDHLRERRQWNEAGGGEEPVARGCRVGAFAAGVGDGQFDGSHGGGSAFRFGSVRRERGARRREAGSKAPASP